MENLKLAGVAYSVYLSPGLLGSEAPPVHRSNYPRVPLTTNTVYLSISVYKPACDKVKKISQNQFQTLLLLHSGCLGSRSPQPGGLAKARRSSLGLFCIFLFIVCVHVCVCVCARTGEKWELLGPKSLILTTIPVGRVHESLIALVTAHVTRVWVHTHTHTGMHAHTHTYTQRVTYHCYTDETVLLWGCFCRRIEEFLSEDKSGGGGSTWLVVSLPATPH